MARTQGLGPDARRFRSGRPCLDFAHTGGDGPLAVFELLHNLDDACHWLAVVLDLDGIVPDDAGLTDVLALRRAIWTTATRVAAGQLVRSVDRATINRAAVIPPIVPQLGSSGGSHPAAPPSLRQALSTLARDAIDLFGGPFASRLRVCSAPDCGLLFVDQSRPGARRWCSMQRCGNLTKVRRYRARRADGTSDD